MNKFKHILAIFIVLVLIATGAYILPKLGLDSNLLPKEEEQAAIQKDSLAIPDTLPFVERMQTKLEVIQAKYSKIQKRDIWTLGKGRTIVYYLLQAQRFLDDNGGKVLYMEELFNDPTVSQSAKLDALSPNGDTLHLKLQVSSSIFRDNASYLSIAFQVTKLSPELIVALNELDFPYDLLITPFGMSSEFFPDLDRIKDKELVLWLLMESHSLDSRHNKMRPIRSHHTEEQIEEIIASAKALVPSASGIATRFAEQAMEHKPLLQTVLNAASKNGLWFLDLSMNNKSKLNELCKESSLDCQILAPYNPSNSTLDDYIHQKLRGAFRNGIGAMILPLSTESIAKVQSMKEKATAQGTTLIYLSTFMKKNKELP